MLHMCIFFLFEHPVTQLSGESSIFPMNIMLLYPTVILQSRQHQMIVMCAYVCWDKTTWIPVHLRRILIDQISIQSRTIYKCFVWKKKFIFIIYNASYRLTYGKFPMHVFQVLYNFFFRYDWMWCMCSQCVHSNQDTHYKSSKVKDIVSLNSSFTKGLKMVSDYNTAYTLLKQLAHGANLHLLLWRGQNPA